MPVNYGPVPEFEIHLYKVTGASEQEGVLDDLSPVKLAGAERMNQKAVRFVPALTVVALFLLISPSLRAQEGGLSGTISGPGGAAVANAKVSVKNVATGESTETESNEAGVYSVPNLAAGEYEVSVSAEGFNQEQAKVTVRAGAAQTFNLALTPALSLAGLGFPSSQTKGSAKEQALLNKRSHMLHVHQELGLITTIPLVATVVTGFGAGGRSTSSSTRDLHAALGSVTAGLYFTTAYYAIFAPKLPGTKTQGSIRLHKALAWIHGPGMVLTPILGAMAFNQKSQGEKVHGIASVHGEVAIVTAVAYGLAILSVSKPHMLHAFLNTFSLHRSAAADAYSDTADGSGTGAVAANP
jgi:Carboxypeptidase regulatory-like domain